MSSGWWLRMLKERISGSYWLGFQPSLSHSFLICTVLDYFDWISVHWLPLQEYQKSLKYSQSAVPYSCGNQHGFHHVFSLLPLRFMYKKLVQWLLTYENHLLTTVLKSDPFYIFYVVIHKLQWVCFDERSHFFILISQTIKQLIKLNHA